jgi:hypothetical protein
MEDTLDVADAQILLSSSARKSALIENGSKFVMRVETLDPSLNFATTDIAFSEPFLFHGRWVVGQYSQVEPSEKETPKLKLT